MLLLVSFALLCGVVSPSPLSCDHACAMDFNIQGCDCTAEVIPGLYDDINPSDAYQNTDFGEDIRQSGAPLTKRKKGSSTMDNVYSPVLKWGKRADELDFVNDDFDPKVYSPVFRWGKRADELSFVNDDYDPKVHSPVFRWGKRAVESNFVNDDFAPKLHRWGKRSDKSSFENDDFDPIVYKPIFRWGKRADDLSL